MTHIRLAAIVTTGSVLFASALMSGQAPAPASSPGAPPGQAAAAQGQGRGPQQPMSFFVTSAGKGDGGNLGGLAGADAQCQALAAAAGRGNVTWRAYLSTQGANAVN